MKPPKGTGSPWRLHRSIFWKPPFHNFLHKLIRLLEIWALLENQTDSIVYSTEFGWECQQDWLRIMVRIDYYLKGCMVEQKCKNNIAGRTKQNLPVDIFQNEPMARINGYTY